MRYDLTEMDVAIIINALQRTNDCINTEIKNLVAEDTVSSRKAAMQDMDLTCRIQGLILRLE